MNYAYILECGDGTLYTGWTNDLEKRLKTHNEGKGGKYTRSRLPVKLVYFEEYGSPTEDCHIFLSGIFGRPHVPAMVYYANSYPLGGQSSLP